ncbi:adenosylcobinamide-phosphate synthase CbiB [Alicyclobacillus tolerans]|uniref:Cobalamin biosynthesis protein CobD n=1 Tax=Alicyclobacillus tolerans TaxID=90970 RepID=A0A1M6KGB0_9BACL|nr:adenosylcobinamide-phosphate synthase CbiB [Alicyclobacillus montanus]SHJ57991.1 adenosylcobinamide-phosphate synthase [Alicyclobacillus montanus]
MNLFFITFLALVLDRIIGDPHWIPHPVIILGKYIAWFEKRWNTPGHSRQMQRIKGILLTLSTLLIASVPFACLLFLLYHYIFWLAVAINVFVIATTIAWKGLEDAGWGVLHRLQKEGLDSARNEVAKIVGRDTENLSEVEVLRATVETLAENIVDAIVSPVFYACIGGAPLAMLYRATNTLDSMVGYKNERYQEFGWASARFDDFLNFIPARFTAVLLWIAIGLTGNNARRAWKIMFRDARKHPSPNSGIAESMVAGGLDLQLGGVNYYGGVPSHRALLGNPTRSLESKDIVRVIRIIQVTCLILLMLTALGGVLIWRL